MYINNQQTLKRYVQCMPNIHTYVCAFVWLWWWWWCKNNSRL